MARPTIGLRLRERLGPDGSEDLLKAFDEVQSDMLAITRERFEARVTATASELRVEMSNGFAKLRTEMAEGAGQLRTEMAEGTAKLRTEMAEGAAKLRTEMAESAAKLRVEMAEGFANLRKEMSDMRVDILRWSFLFWIGQIAVLISVLSYMLRPLIR